MVSLQRRLNSTGRKRIPRERVIVELEPPLDSMSFPHASARVDLAGIGLDGNANVMLEAYFRSSSMRFPCGQVGKLAVPPRMDLTEIDRGGAIQFRLLVIASDRSGRIIAAADGIRPARKNDGPERQSLLTVTETDLGEQLWKVDIDVRAGPRLLLNSRIPGIAAKLRTTSLYQGLILPHALRAVLRGLQPEGEDDDDNIWGDNWRVFLTEMGLSAEPEQWDDDELKEEWIEDAVERFCALKKFADQLRAQIVTSADE